MTPRLWLNRPTEMDDPCQHLSQLLQKFQASHPVQTLRHANHTWKFVASGRGDTTVALLPGLGGTYEVEFEVIGLLETRFRVVSVGYPASVSTAEDLVEGVSRLLDSEGVAAAFLLGHSLGGMVAEVCAMRYPGRVRGLVLANSGVFRGWRKWIVPSAAHLLGCLPERLLAPLVIAQLSRLTEAAPARGFWRSYFRTMLASPGTSQYLKRQSECLMDLNHVLGGAFVRATLPGAMPVLVIESEDDGAFPGERASPRLLHPDADVYVFRSPTGHLSWLTKPTEFVSIVERFLVRAAGGA